MDVLLIQTPTNSKRMYEYTTQNNHVYKTAILVQSIPFNGMLSLRSFYKL